MAGSEDGQPEAAQLADFEPLDEDALGILCDPSALHVLIALDDGVDTADAVAADTGLPREEVWARLTELVNAGLVEVVDPGEGAAADEPGRFRPRVGNVKDTDGKTYSRVAFRLAILSAVEQVVRHGRRALRRRPDEAIAGVAFVTLPEDMGIVEDALAILAETEQRLKALAKENRPKPGEPSVRLSLLISSQ